MIDIFSKARNKQLSEKKILAIRGPGYELNNPGTNIMVQRLVTFDFVSSS